MKKLLMIITAGALAMILGGCAESNYNGTAETMPIAMA